MGGLTETGGILYLCDEAGSGGSFCAVKLYDDSHIENLPVQCENYE